MLLNTKTLEDAYTELEAELARADQRADALAQVVANLQDVTARQAMTIVELAALADQYQAEKLWRVVTLLYKRGMWLHKAQARKVLPELELLD